MTKSFTPTPGLVLDYIPCAGGARLVRAFSDDPCPILPEQLDGLPLVQLGDYCFAAQQRASALPPEEQILRYIVPGGTPSENRIGGNFLYAITLPDTLRSIGNCAFYNCRSLTSIYLGTNAQSVGSDVFLNTFALKQLTVRAQPDRPCGLFAILNSITTDVRVVFQPEDTILAAAYYPEYWMDVQETPAHILLQTYSGQGFHYRQCFNNEVPEWDSYDAILAQSGSSDPARVMTLLALDRLRWPFALSENAKKAYRSYLAENVSTCISVLLKQQDTQTLSGLLALDIMDEPALQQAAEKARQSDNAAFAALLADALQKKQPKPAAKANRYDFDF